jgi:hypothetical protein
MMTTSYDAIVQEKENDITTMNVSKYQLQVAKSVSNPGGAPSFNVIYASKLLGPNMSVSWTANYALSWSTDIAAPGAQVSYSGNWTPCAVGESFDLDVDGYFKPNPNNPNGDASSLNVGSNNYPVPVNIVVGVEDSTKPGTYTAVRHNRQLESYNTDVHRFGLIQLSLSRKHTENLLHASLCSFTIHRAIKLPQ